MQFLILGARARGGKDENRAVEQGYTCAHVTGAVRGHQRTLSAQRQGHGLVAGVAWALYRA